MAYFILFLLQSSLLLLLVMGIRALGKEKLPPTFVYALWLVPMLRLCVPFGGIGIPGTAGYGKFVMEPVRILGISAEKAEAFFTKRAEAGESQGNAIRKEGLHPAEKSVTYLPKEPIITKVMHEGEERYWQDPQAKEYGTGSGYTEHTYIPAGMESIDTAAAENTHVYGDANLPGAMPFSGETMHTAACCLTCIWLTGTVFLGLYAWKKNRQFIRAAKRGGKRLELEEGGLLLEVYEVGGLDSPCLAGIAKPFIAVNGKAASDGKLLSYVLLHEMSHYKQKDHIWTFLRNLLCIVYWWNPLVWKGAECCAEDAEFACDRRVTAGMGAEQKKGYGNALLSLIDDSGRHTDMLCQSTTMAGRKSVLVRRMERIAKAGKPSRAWSVAAGAVLLLAAAGCGVKPKTDAIVQEGNTVHVGEEHMATETTEDAIRDIASEDVSDGEDGNAVPMGTEGQAADNWTVTKQDAMPIDAIGAEGQASASRADTDQGSISIDAERQDQSPGRNTEGSGNEDAEKNASLDYENLEMGYIIFHTEQKIYIYDTVQKDIIREITVKDKGQNQVQLTNCTVEVSEDGMWVYVKPETAETMYSYSLRYHDFYLVPAKEIEGSYDKAKLSGTIFWADEETERKYQSGGNGQEYLLFSKAEKEALHTDEREPRLYDNTDGDEEMEAELYSELREQADTLDHLAVFYVKMLNSWDYRGVCELSEGVYYEGEAEETWRGIEGNVVASYVEGHGNKYCLLLTMDIAQTGSSGLEEGRNEKYLYVRLGPDKYGNKRWYADGGMRDAAADWRWWNDHIISNGENWDGGGI